MSSSSVRLLCTGDLHLGRYPSRVPPDRRLAVDHIWQCIVDYAVGQRVDAVVLTGDVVDRDNRFFEAFGPLQAGLQRLGNHGIGTFAVTGNHDYDVLGRLEESLNGESFRVLGRGSRWETTTIARDGAPVLRLAGWSFSAEKHRVSPLPELDLPPADVPTVGVLHADLDQPESPYAPVSRRDLNAAPVAAWLLGHIHKPAQHAHRDGCILYPGSPQPLDPGEEGTHGPWLVDVRPDGRVAARQIPLSTIGYITLEVPLEAVEDRAGFERVVTSAVREHLASTTEAHGDLLCVVYRLRCFGRTRVHRELPAWCDELRDGLRPSSRNATAFVDRIALETRPAVDLEALAQRKDPPGMLARLLLELEQGEPSEATAALVRRAAAKMGDVWSSSAHAPLRQEERTSTRPTLEEAQLLLQRQGLLLLDALMDQKRPQDLR